MSFARLRWLLYLLAALPALGTLYLVFQLGVDIPFLDQWHDGIAGLFIKAHWGQLHLSDLLAQQNEHRIVVPRVVILLLGWLTHWNTLWELRATWFIACLTSLGLLFLIHRSCTQTGLAKAHVAGLWLLCNLLLFSPASWEVWLWGMGIQFILPGAFLVGALVVAQMSLHWWIKLSICILLCTAATFTHGNGLLTWPLVGMLLLLADLPSRITFKMWILVAWLVALGINIAMYRYGYVEPAHPPEAAASVHRIDQIRYAFAFMGSPFAYCSTIAPLSMAMGSGVVMLVLLVSGAGYFCVGWGRPQSNLCRAMLPWFCLAGFTVASAIVTAEFRTTLAVDQALSSRYCIIAVALPIALINLVAICLGDLAQRHHAPALFRTIAAVVITLLLMLHLQGVPRTFHAAEVDILMRRQFKGGILLADVVPDNPFLKACGQPTPEALAKIRALDDMGYIHPKLIRNANASALQDDALLRPPNSGVGGIEKAGLDRPGTYQLSGWAILPSLSQQAHTVFLTYDNERGEPIIFAAAELGVERLDVAKQLGSQYFYCGWHASFPPSRLPSYLKRAKISAWALDTSTAKAVKLEGGPIFEL